MQENVLDPNGSGSTTQILFCTCSSPPPHLPLLTSPVQLEDDGPGDPADDDYVVEVALPSPPLLPAAGQLLAAGLANTGLFEGRPSPANRQPGIKMVLKVVFSFFLFAFVDDKPSAGRFLASRPGSWASLGFGSDWFKCSLLLFFASRIINEIECRLGRKCPVVPEAVAQDFYG